MVVTFNYFNCGLHLLPMTPFVPCIDPTVTAEHPAPHFSSPTMATGPSHHPESSYNPTGVAQSSLASGTSGTSWRLPVAFSAKQQISKLCSKHH